MKNSADLGGCYPPRPSASVGNTLLYLQNSSYPTQPHSIIAKYCVQLTKILTSEAHFIDQDLEFCLLEAPFPIFYHPFTKEASEIVVLWQKLKTDYRSCWVDKKL